MLPRYGKVGASSRVRIYQYVPSLRGEFDVHVAPFFQDTYLEALYRGKRDLPGIVAAYARRLKAAFEMHRFDLAWVEAELLPWIPWPLENLLTAAAVPLAADYDDAIFHRYDSHSFAPVRSLLGRKIASFMRRAKTVLAGNQYIASYARQAGATRVHLVPTVVDTSRYEAHHARRTHGFTIGWIGTPSTQHYIGLAGEALRFAHRSLKARIVLIGASRNPLADTPVELRQWRESTEATELAEIDVGIMPLSDSPWELGKCGYKLLQYMACGKPVVASPVGVNREIVEHGVNGYLASTSGDWIDAFRALHGDLNRASKMGSAGRAKVERAYSLAAVAPRVARILSEAAG